jgi:hypothetical protein
VNTFEPTRRDELLADGALAWLAPADDAAFTALLREAAAAGELAELERAAALGSFACIAPAIPPEHDALVRLTAKLVADAHTFFGETRTDDANGANGAVRSFLPPPDAGLEPEPRSQRTLRVATWVLAAASLLLFVLFVAQPRHDRREPTPDAARAALLRSSAELVLCDWTPGPSSPRGEIGGDVVWDPVRHEGFLRLRGLPPLEPTQRYQLWIVDAARSGPPVDGGLLPLAGADAAAVVKVSARLPVRRAAAFVLTIEGADGVVVSAQEHVVAIAKP